MIPRFLGGAIKVFSFGHFTDLGPSAFPQATSSAMWHHTKVVAPQFEIWLTSEEGLAYDNKAGYAQNGVMGKMVELEAVKV